MSAVLGIDLSTKAIDLVRLDETTNHADWTHVELVGATALERLRQVELVMPRGSYYDDVYLAAIEAPMSRGQQGTLAKLSRVLGAIVACIPATLELWEITPMDWRMGLGISGRATKEQAAEAVDDLRGNGQQVWAQDALDAFACAYYARQLNARALTRL